MSFRITRAVWERCSLLLETDGGETLCWRRENGDTVRSGRRLNLACAGGNRPLPGGVWRLADAVWDAGEPIRADFSGDGTRYLAALGPEGDGVCLRIEYRPRRAPLSEKLADGLLRVGYRLGRLTPGKAGRVLFTSESRATADGNMAFVRDAARKAGLCDPFDVRFSFRRGSRAAFYAKTAFLMGRCDTLVVDDYFPLLYHLRPAKSVRIVQLWHACGAYKTVGYSRLGKRGAPRIDGMTHRCYTHVLVSSEAVRPFYAEAFGLPMERVIATGVARTDVFFDPDYAKTQKDAFAAAFPQATGKRVVLFAPTFRGDGKETAHYPPEALDLPRLAELCRQKGLFVVFKMHPFVTGFSLPEGYEDVFADATDRREINDLLFAADLLVTDYSSVIYEASLLGLPMLFYVFDLADYTASRSFYEPFEAYAAGRIANTFDELLAAMESGDSDAARLDAFRQKSMGRCDGNAAKRAAEIIFDPSKIRKGEFI